MINLKRINNKPTFIFISSILIILISIPIFIYSYNNSDSSTEGWVLTFALFLYIFVGFIYSLDRMLVKFIDYKKLSYYELVASLILIILTLYSFRTYRIDISNSKHDYVIVVENPGDVDNTNFNATSFFDREYKSTEEIITMNHIPNNLVRLEHPKNWDSNIYDILHFKKYGKVIIFYNADEKISQHVTKIVTEKLIDSLIENRKK